MNPMTLIDRKRLFLESSLYVAVVNCLLLLVPPPACADITLVDRGQPTATLILADPPSEQSQDAAEILQRYLFRISGASLEIRLDSESVEGNRVLIGKSRATEALGVEVPSGKTYEMNEEGFVSKTLGSDLVLAGNEDWDYQGTLFAVYDLLEELGCRWYYPGEFGEVLPKMKTVRIPERDRTQRPDFRFRNIWLAGGFPISVTDSREFREWSPKNKMSSLNISFPSDGSVKNLAPAEKFREAYPHIYALGKDGRRHEEMLCMSEEDSVRISVKTIKEYFQNHPEVNSFGFAHPMASQCAIARRASPTSPVSRGWGMGIPVSLKSGSNLPIGSQRRSIGKIPTSGFLPMAIQTGFALPSVSRN